MREKTNVITGCPSGFGRITALELASRGWHVFATVRKAMDQESLLNAAASLGNEDRIHPIKCDITQDEQVSALAQTVTAANS